jgi:hypothetical protein
MYSNRQNYPRPSFDGHNWNRFQPRRTFFEGGEYRRAMRLPNPNRRRIPIRRYLDPGFSMTRGWGNQMVYEPRIYGVGLVIIPSMEVGIPAGCRVRDGRKVV